MKECDSDVEIKVVEAINNNALITKIAEKIYNAILGHHNIIPEKIYHPMLHDHNIISIQNINQFEESKQRAAMLGEADEFSAQVE